MFKGISIIIIIGTILTQTKVNTRRAGWILVGTGIIVLLFELYLEFFV